MLQFYIAMIRYVYKAFNRYSLEQPYYRATWYISYNIFKVTHKDKPKLKYCVIVSAALTTN